MLIELMLCISACELIVPAHVVEGWIGCPEFR